ncbi:MAG: hypothetical protein A2X48_08200 [Lentisphaerae bacterium GWF2_49_21]|nr:MAG: hypothetical protein A2X48_08200 [Lentisphaerae bacterium GWF2_49_21]
MIAITTSSSIRVNRTTLAVAPRRRGAAMAGAATNSSIKVKLFFLSGDEKKKFAPGEFCMFIIFLNPRFPYYIIKDHDLILDESTK